MRAAPRGHRGAGVAGQIVGVKAAGWPRRGRGGPVRLWRVGGYVQRVSALYGRKKGHRMGGLVCTIGCRVGLLGCCLLILWQQRLQVVRCNVEVVPYFIE